MIRATPRLAERLMLIVLLPTVLLSGLFGGLFMFRATHNIDEGLRLRGLAVVSFLAPAAEFGVISGNRDALGQLLDAAIRQSDLAAAAIFDDAGRKIVSNGRVTHAGPAPVLQADRPTLIRETDTLLGFAAPIQVTPFELSPYRSLEAQPETIGHVYIEVLTATSNRAKTEIVISTLIVAMLGVLISWWLGRRLAGEVSEPLMELARAVRRIAAGDRAVRIPRTARIDELISLREGFADMATAIIASRDTLQQRVDEATAQLAHQATHDALTDLPNRRAFEDALEQALNISVRRSTDSMVLCFIDLDRFKIVNDTAGHAAGDALLRKLATTIRTLVRNEDQIFRIGGDEFALLLQGCTRDEAVALANTLREAVAALRFEWEHKVFTVGASIGLVPLQDKIDSPGDALAAADMACYAAKKRGRNQVIVADPQNPAKLLSPIMQPTLQQLDLEQFRLFVQPICALLPSSVPARAEVLLRTRESTHERISEIVARFESEGRGAELDLWVLQNAVQLAGTDPSIHLTLNLTATSLIAHGRYLSSMRGLLEPCDVAPDRLTLELPASLAEREADNTRRLAEGARALGCRIALEQINGKHASLLRTLRPDFAKVSMKQLVETYGIDAGQNLASALCATCRSLGIETIASEVEDSTHDLLEMGFEWAQGYLLATPRPLD